MATKITTTALTGIRHISWFRVVVCIMFCLGLSLLLKLGFWQLSRMAEKTAIAQLWAAGCAADPMPLSHFLSGKQMPQPGQPVILPSLAVLEPIFLLDNERYHGQSGYRVFRLGQIPDNGIGTTLPMVVLIAGHWVSYASVQASSVISALSVPKIGYIGFPSSGLRLGTQAYQLPVKWPLIVQWIDTNALSHVTGQAIAPFWVQSDRPPLPHLSPHQHLAYAIQWFLFAVLWMGYGIFLSCRR